MILALDGQARGWKTLPVLGTPPPDAPPGWEIALYRKMRGLSAPEEMQTPPLMVDDVPPKKSEWQTVEKWVAGVTPEKAIFGVLAVEQTGKARFCPTQPVAGMAMPLPAGSLKWIVEWPLSHEPGEVRFYVEGILHQTERKGNRARILFKHQNAGLVHFFWQSVSGEVPQGLPLRLMVWQLRTPPAESA